MFVELMKEETIKSAKLNSFSPLFLPAHEGGLVSCICDNGVIIRHSAHPAAEAISPSLLITAQGHCIYLGCLKGDPQSFIFPSLPPA